MKPIELYQREPESISRDLNDLDICTFHSPFPELIDNHWFNEEEHSNDPKVEIRTYKHNYYDHRRYWKLWSVYFEGSPVMILQNAGREGDDHKKRFITDYHLYTELVDYLDSLLPKMYFSSNDMVSDEEDIEELTSFYQDHL